MTKMHGVNNVKFTQFLKLFLAVLEILHAERHQVRQTWRSDMCIFNLSAENILKARIRLNFSDRSLKEGHTKSHIIQLAPHTLKRSQYRLSPESRLLKSLPFRFSSDPFPPFLHIPKAERNVEGEFQRFQTFQ
jgi:hypothetical protein